MFPAVEAAAQERATIVDQAAVRSQIHAPAAPVRGKGEDRIAGDAMSQNLELVGFHLVALVRMENQPLITLATFCAAVAGYIRPLIWQQSPLSTKKRLNPSRITTCTSS